MKITLTLFAALLLAPLASLRAADFADGGSPATLRALCDKRHFVSFFNDLQAAADHPVMPAAQYFSTKGYFAGYDANLDEPLTEAVKAVWQEGFEKLEQGSLEPMSLARAVHAAEAKRSSSTSQERGDFLQGIFDRLSQPR